MKIEDKMKDALVGLIIQAPFFGSLALKFPLAQRKDIPTMAVSFDGHIWYNPEWCAERTRNELIFLLAHESMHQALAHMARRGKRDPKVWNIANDAVINDILKKEGIGTFVKGGVDLRDASLKTSEQLYDELMQNQDEQESGSGMGSGSGDGDGEENCPTLSDDLQHDEGEERSEQENANAITNAKVVLAQAAAQAKMMGKLSGHLERLCNDFIDSKVPWWQMLEEYFTGKASQKISWSRPNKRYLRTAYMPRRERQPSMGPVIIGIDTSGSITSEEVAKYFGHLQAIVEQCNPSSVTVVYCDYSVVAVDRFTPGEYPVTHRKRLPGGGGTDMTAITRWIETECEEEPEVCVIFTDGYTPFPNTATCPLVWVCTTDAMDNMKVLGKVIRDWRR